MKSIILVILHACSIATLQSQSRYDSIDTAIQNFMAEKKIPGFVACVVKDKKISWSKSYGDADIQRQVRMSIDGIMNIGSISKTFTTAAAMQLWEQRQLDLDTDVGKYIGTQIRNPKHPDKVITIFQILTHTSSIIDGKAYPDSYACGDPAISLENWIYGYLTPGGRYFHEGNFGDWSPGTKERYSNVAFGLLGLIVEKIAKQPFNEYCREKIFRPLGMNNTGWMLSEIDTARHIRPYAFVNQESMNDILENKKLYVQNSKFEIGRYVEHCLYSFPNYPDGLVRTSVRELSLYLAAMMNVGELNGKRILKKETIDKVLSLQVQGNNTQGLTWHTHQFQSTAGQVILWGHTGGDPGINTYLFFEPKQKIGVITFQNHDTGGTFPIVEQLYQAAAEGEDIGQ